MQEAAANDAVYLVLCTVAEAQAPALAEQLVRERHAACVNLVGPVQSVYRWEGEVEQGREVLLLIKTAGATRASLRQRLVELHTYRVPEILEFAADSGLPAYLGWVTGSCGIPGD